MIKSFKNLATAEVAQGLQSKLSRRVLPIELHKTALLKLAVLNRAKSLQDMLNPAFRLEKLKGDRAGQYSVRINRQYRICFEWRNDGVYNVQIIDYHS